MTTRATALLFATIGVGAIVLLALVTRRNHFESGRCREVSRPVHESGTSISSQFPARDPLSESQRTAQDLTKALDACEDAVIAENVEQLIDAIMAAGQSVRTSPTDAHACLLALRGRSGCSAKKALASLILAGYASAESDFVSVTLQRSDFEERFSYALIIGLTWQGMPPALSRQEERQFWREILLSVSEIIPSYREKYEAEAAAGRSQEFLNVPMPNEISSRMERRKLGSSVATQAIFDRIVNQGNPALLRRFYGWIDWTDRDIAHQIVASYTVAPTKELRAELIDCLSHAPSDIVISRLSEWYAREGDPSLRQRLGQKLIDVQPEVAASTFNALFGLESDSRVRHEYMRSLACVKSQAALDALVNLAESGSQSDRLAAISMMVQYHRAYGREQKERVFLRCLQDASEDVRVASLEALWGLDQKKYTEILASTRQTDPSSKVRSTAASLLERLKE